MRAPEFWGPGRGGMAAALLAPLGRAWAIAADARLRLARPARAPVPVLCVGNLVAGGAGKTPVVLSLARRLAVRGPSVHVITRGYGGTLAGPVRVEPGRHGYREVGDEALLLAAAAPTWVARDREAGCRAAAAAAAATVVLDDGFQSPSVVKDRSLVVVDGGYGLGNGRVMPAGPLREAPARGLARADAVVLVGADETGVRDGLDPRLPVLGARVRPGPEGAALAGVPVFAFAGIGRPGKFFRTLDGLGADVRGTLAFPDHHPYDKGDLERIARAAGAADAVPVTTAKDAVRLPEEAALGVRVLTITVEWEDEAALDRFLEPFLGPPC